MISDSNISFDKQLSKNILQFLWNFITLDSMNYTNKFTLLFV